MEEGAKVEANYRGSGHYYPGKIKRVRLDGDFDIAYDDGEFEEQVPPSRIRSKEAQPKTDPAASSSLSSSSVAEDSDKLLFILGKSVWNDFSNSFKDLDKYRDGELDVRTAVQAYVSLGGRVGVDEVRLWLTTNGTPPRGRGRGTACHFADFVLCYANLFYPSDDSLSTIANINGPNGTQALGRTLRLAAEDQELATFATRFGKKQLRSLEDAFDKFGSKDGDDAVKIACRDLIEAFLSMGRGITVSRMLEWMAEADIRPMDRLTLADFVSVYAYFFSPVLGGGEMSLRGTLGIGAYTGPFQAGDNIPSGTGTARGLMLTIAEVAVQVLQEQRWSGSVDQTVSFMQRLCAGRAGSVVQTIVQIRESFDEADTGTLGSVSLSSMLALFERVNLPMGQVTALVDSFSRRLMQQGRERFSLPEVYETFGPMIQEYSSETPLF